MATPEDSPSARTGDSRSEPGSDYLLGSERAEQARLDLQADYYRMATVDAMRWAGLGPGQRVLDIGSGTGAVAFEAARLVGTSGSVLGLDASPAAVAAANRNAARLGLDNVRFEVADLDQWSSTERFDALTGRLITMFLPEPARIIAALAGHLQPGGVVLLEEFSMTSFRQRPETPILRRTLERVHDTFRASGIPTDLGFDLGALFRAAGLGTPTIAIGGRWEDSGDAVAYALLTQITRTLAPAMLAYGIATEDELDLERLEGELRRAAREVDAGIFMPLLLSAWATVR